MILFYFFAFYTTISAWRLPSGLQQFFREYSPYAPAHAPTVRFENGTDCEPFIKKLYGRSAIAYNYGLDENKAGGRWLVNCLLRDEAAARRLAIREIYVAAPVIGSPKPKQKAFLELIKILPNLDTIRYDDINVLIVAHVLTSPPL
jgi:hypothetical protein